MRLHHRIVICDLAALTSKCEEGPESEQGCVSALTNSMPAAWRTAKMDNTRDFYK